MGELVLILIITWAFKHAWDHSRGDYRRSLQAHRQKQPARQKRSADLVHHDIGYWTHQGTHFFPAFRHGFGQGWHDARQKAAASRAEWERAKTEHLEDRASLLPQIRELRERQRRAWEAIRSEQDPHDQGASGVMNVPVPQAPAAPGVPEAPGEGREGSGQPAGSAPQEPAVQAPTAPELRPVTTTEGEQPMPARTGEVTYDGVIAAMAAECRDLETRATEQAQAITRTQNTGDAMQGLNLDAATLSAMADHEDAQHSAFKALEACMATAQAVHAVLTRGHQGLAEAHKDAPVEAADKEFYAA